MILLVVLIAGTGLRLALIHPAQNYLLDFRAYYSAALAATHGINPYDADAVRANVSLPGKQQIVGYLYPPATLWLLAGFSLLPYPAAQVPWLVLQFALGLAAFGLMLWMTRCEFGSLASVLLGFTFFCSSAVAELFRWGQFDMIVLLLVSLGVFALFCRRSAAGGLWLGLATIAKVSPIIYLGVLAFRRQWKGAVAGGAIVGVLLAAGLIWPGFDATASWLTSLRAFSADTHAIMSPNNQSLTGFVYRAFANHPTHEGPSTPWVNLGIGPARWIALTLNALLCVSTFAWIWLYRRRLKSHECVFIAIPLVLLVSPITTAHHCVQMLVPLAFIIAAVCRREDLRPLDMGWITLIILLFVIGGNGRIESATSPRLNLLISPTTTYSVALTWVFCIFRYIPLRRPATNPAYVAGRREAAGRAAMGTA